VFEGSQGNKIIKEGTKKTKKKEVGNKPRLTETGEGSGLIDAIREREEEEEEESLLTKLRGEERKRTRSRKRKRKKEGEEDEDTNQVAPLTQGFDPQGKLL
jgi:hypothetical protein